MTGHAESLGQELDAVIFKHVDSRLQQEGLAAGVAQGLQVAAGGLGSRCCPRAEAWSFIGYLFYTSPRKSNVWSDEAGNLSLFPASHMILLQPAGTFRDHCQLSSNPEEWFRRCSGDWSQIRNANKLPGDWTGRSWFGTLCNFDEAYDFLLSLGLLSDPNGSTKEKAKTKVNQAAAIGSSAGATKTGGSYGESPTKTISLGVTCNMRYIPMERGEVRSHAASTKERFLISTSVCPKDRVKFCSWFGGMSRYRWAPLTHEIADLIGVAKEAMSPAAAAQEWKEAGIDH
eukprot:s5105_g3.t1